MTINTLVLNIFLIVGFICSCVIIRNAYMPITEYSTNIREYDFINVPGSVDRFLNALKFRTISWNRDHQNLSAFNELTKYIFQNYPQLKSSKHVKVEVISNYSLLYILKGLNSSLSPAVFLAHLDVVPTDGQEWDSDPFLPKLSDGYIYARGTIDNKNSVFGLLEAAELLTSEGHRVERDIILAFGHDEEIRGYNGAGKIAKRLYQMGYRRFEFLMDEGLTIITDAVPGVESTFALIGTSQKGYVTFNLSVDFEGGHSSMPGKESAIGILAAAVKRIENNPFPSHLGHESTAEMFQRLAREMPFFKRIILSNVWIFKPIIEILLSSQNQMNALIRTTTAVTQFHAGIKENVLSQTAWATVNCRIHPADTGKSVIDFLRRIINDERVQIKAKDMTSSSGPAPSRGVFGYELIAATLKQMYPATVVSPGLMIAMTDSTWYANFTDNIYLFNPIVIQKADLTGIHGKNERISIKSYEGQIEFYYRFMKNINTFHVYSGDHSHLSEI